MSTLFTRIIDDTGSGVAGASITLRRRWGPQARVGAVTDGNDLILTADTNGFITSPIVGGVFRVWVWKTGEPRLITIPDDDGTYLLQDLLGITGGTAALTYRYVGACLQILNGTSGQFRTFRVRGASGSLQLAVDQDNNMAPNFQWIDGCLQIRNADTDTWHPIYISGAAPQIAIGAAGTTFAPNARVLGGKLQLRNTTTNLYHTIYLSGDAPAWVIAAGEA